MSIYKDIRAALETRLAGVAGLPSGIQHEAVSFEPTANTSYLEVVLVPTLRVPAVRGPNPQMRYQGVFRVFCYIPSGSGPAEAETMAQLVLEAFDATTDISYTNTDGDTIIVSIDYADVNSGVTEGNSWYYIPVNIGWYIYSD